MSNEQLLHGKKSSLIPASAIFKDSYEALLNPYSFRRYICLHPQPFLNQLKLRNGTALLIPLDSRLLEYKISSMMLRVISMSCFMLAWLSTDEYWPGSVLKPFLEVYCYNQHFKRTFPRQTRSGYDVSTSICYWYCSAWILYTWKAQILSMFTS